MMKRELPSFLEIKQRESDKLYAVWCKGYITNLLIDELKDYSSDCVCSGVEPSYNKAMALGNTFVNRDIT